MKRLTRRELFLSLPAFLAACDQMQRTDLSHSEVMPILREAPPPVAPPSSEPKFPRLSQCRVGSRNYTLDSAEGAAERARLATRSVVYLGMRIGGDWDDPDPGALGALSRAAVLQDLKIRNPDLYVYDYVNLMETGLTGAGGTKCQAEVGPTGNGGNWTPNDWLARSTTGQTVSTFPGNVQTNPTTFVTLDASQWDYCDWYYDRIQTNIIDPHAALGVGKDGINIFIDNMWHKARSGSGGVVRDLDRDGNPDNGRSNPLAHEEVAWRLAYVKLCNLLRTNNPGILITGNNTDWFDEDIPGDTMRDEYVGLIDGGITENITKQDGNPFSEVFADGTRNPSGFGSWALGQEAYTHDYANVVGLKHQTYVAAVQVNDPLNITSGAFNVYRWTHCSALLDNGWYSVDENSNYNRTLQFDEMGTTDGSALQPGWLGYPIDDTPVTTALHDTLMWREFDGGGVLVNTSLTTPTIVTCPGDLDTGVWRFADGTQDSAVNTGATITSDFTIDEIDGRFVVRN